MAKVKSMSERVGQFAKETEVKGDSQSNDTKMLNTRIPKDLIKRLKFYCADKEITIQGFITEAVREKLESSDF